MRTIIVALALIFAVYAQNPTQYPHDRWRCREPMQFSAMLSIVSAFSYIIICISIIID